MTDFFMRRPVLAVILNFMILVVGLLSYQQLSLREYPDIKNSQMVVRVLYPNASPEVVEREITDPLEETLASLEGIEEISSISKYGMSVIEIHFKDKIPPNEALANIRDKLGTVRDTLPEDAKEPLVEPKSEGSGAFIFLSLTGDNYHFAELTHLARLYLKDPLKTIKGVAQVEVMGDSYVMSVALDRNKLLLFDLDAVKIYNYLNEFNLSMPAGRYDGRVPLNFDLTLENEEDFANLPVGHFDGKIIFLKDVAEIKLDSSKQFLARKNGQKAVLIGLNKANDGNPLEISKFVHEHLENYQRLLPDDVRLSLDFDKTKFIKGSLDSVKQSILEAVALVIIIVFLFLRSFRATLIPVITIPISLVGVLTVMAIFGLSINTITLLALVLAVGLVVDDAIVVLENIHRNIEDGLSPLDAAFKGAREIGFAIIAMTCTLAAVYAPILFINGTIGQVFFEFAVTLAGAVVLSGVIALTFSPLMCSRLLKAESTHNTPHKSRIDLWLQKLEEAYTKGLTRALCLAKPILVGCVLILVGCVYLYQTLPSDITPKEDRGVVGVYMPYVTAAKVEEFENYIRQVETIFANIPEAPMYLSFAGEWGGQVVTALSNWSARKKSAADIVQILNKGVEQVYTTEAYPWSWDSGIPGVEASSAANTGLQVVLNSTQSYAHLSQQTDAYKQALLASGLFQDVHHDLKLNYPSFDIHVDRRKMELAGFKPEALSRQVAIMMDKRQDLEFKKNGLRYPIELRGQVAPSKLEELFAYNEEGKRVALASFMTLKRAVVPQELKHFNKLRAAYINVSLNPGVDMGQAITKMQQIANDVLTSDVIFELSGAAQKLQESSGQMILLIFMAMLFIYCIMAIQFESFVDPLIIMTTVPLAGFGALFLILLTGGSVNIFTQLGLITLIGLITKHGILIVEFANQKLKDVQDINLAINHAATLRLRPILMTTGAMVFGAIPLILSNGAGAEARQAIGYVLFGGLVFGTLLTLFVIPIVYRIIKGYQLRRLHQK